MATKRTNLEIRAEEEHTTPQQLLLSLLEKHNTIREAAAAFGVDYRTFWSYMNKYNVRSKTIFYVGCENELAS